VKIEHYDSHRLFTTFTPDSNLEKWTPSWHGLHRLTECKSPFAESRYQSAENKAHGLGLLSEREYEIDCVLAVMQGLKRPTMTFMEIGAGYGEWCMAVNGVVRNRIVPTAIQRVKAYAVEAEPSHHKWCVEHFDAHNLDGVVIWGAVADKDGDCRFSVMPNAADWYGQSLTVGNGVLRTASNLLRRKSVNVHCHTMDTVLEMLAIERLDLVHVDVQGAEARVVKGAEKAIREGRVDWWMFGTHGKGYNDELEKMLGEKYEVVVNMYPGVVSLSGNERGGVLCQDGIMLFKRKGL
jgi:FkbM family methyltransferase